MAGPQEITADMFMQGAEAPADNSPYRKAPWYSIYKDMRDNQVPMADEPTDPAERDRYLAISAKQVYDNQQKAKSGNRYTEAVDRQGGWGLSPETRSQLGANDAPTDISSVGGYLDAVARPVRNAPANIADLAFRGLQGLQVGIEGTAKTVDDAIDSTGVNDVVQKYLGNKFHPGEGVLALMEAFPAGGLEAGMIPHSAFRTPVGDRLTPELRAQYNKEASALFDAGATREQMNAWAKDRGMVPYGDDFDQAIAARDAARAKDPNAPADMNSLMQASSDTSRIADEAANFKAAPEPKSTDLFPTEASRAADAEEWGKKLGAPEKPIKPAPAIKAVDEIVPAADGTITKKEADALFKQATEEVKAQTPKEWEKSLEAQAAEFQSAKAAEEAPTATEAVPAEVTPTPVEPRLPDGKPNPQAPTGEVIDRLTTAINTAAKVNAKVQRRLYSEARSDRLKKVMAVRQGGLGGEAGLRAEMAQLRGELPKADFEAVRPQFTQGEIDGLFDHIRDHPSLSMFDQINARSGLGKLLDGQVPTRSEISLLDKAFPKEFIQATLKNRSTTSKVLDFTGNALNLPRSLMSTFDLSAPFRQGVFLVGRKEFWKGFSGMFKQFGSEKAYEAVMDSIRQHPNYPWMEEAKLGLTDMGHNLSKREEAFVSQWAEKIPVIGRGVRASERAYTGFLNKLRADTFNTILEQTKATGVDIVNDPKAVKDIASFVNNATGRGSLGPLSQAGPVLNGLFFSPRLMASRVTMLNPAYYATLSPVVRKEAIKSLLAFGALATTVMGVAAASGLDVESDPRSSDFGKPKNGNTRYDILGGFGQYLTLGARLATNETKTMKGQIKTMGQGYGSPTRLDAVVKFLTNKESPVASFITDYLRGENAVGEPFEARKAAVQRMLPLFAQDLYDAYQENGAKGAAELAPGVFGVGVQNFDSNAPTKKDFMAGQPDGKTPDPAPQPSTEIPDTLSAEAFMKGEEAK